MTGYVIINKSVLSDDDFDVYNGYYCGVCKSIGERHGQLPRLGLSYDSVFLAMILSSISKAELRMEREHCLLHHIKKKPVIKKDPAVDYAADMLLILAYHNFLDDKEDEHKIIGSIGSHLLASSYNKLKKQYPIICEAVEDNISKLSLLEKDKSGSLDLTADTFGEILKVVFASYVDYCESFVDGDIPSTKRILEGLGSSLGKWIYVMDAFDDLEKDRKSKSYNPFIYRERGIEGVDDLLYNYLGQVSNAIDLLEIHKNKGIIENVIWNGLRARMELLLQGEQVAQ